MDMLIIMVGVLLDKNRTIRSKEFVLSGFKNTGGDVVRVKFSGQKVREEWR